ncbi:MAG TPA: glycosyltransferase family A protein, partial [Candidatus Saccharimonadales bacterium]|nr:glycosyltransferase family A protein [Candidatus Saccharimonadales bacterium]
MRKEISIIVPARNEEAAIRGTLEALLASTAEFLAKPLSDIRLDGSIVEILVVDNRSTDKTGQVVAEFVKEHGVDYIVCERLGAPCARNFGTRLSRGGILVYVDADTRVPPRSLKAIYGHVHEGKRQAGIFARS